MNKKKRLTDNQSDLVASFLPQKLQKNKKLSASVKLVLANIYQLYYYENNYGKRTVYRTREDFMKDIDAKDKNEVIRPHAVLIQNEMVYIKSGIRGRATEYTLNDELYQLLPKQIRGEASDKFAETLNHNRLNDSNLQIGKSEVISPSHNELNYSVLQHSNVPSETEPEAEIEKEIEKEKKDLVPEAEETFTDEVISTEGTGASAFDTSATVTVISTETDKASAYGVSSSLIEEELASAFEPISTDTSTEDTRNESTVVISTSSNEDLTTADRLTYLQPLEESTPPSSAAPPLTEDFVNHVKAEIRNGVYQWSLNLTEVPDFIVADDYNPIVVEAIKTQPDYNDYLGNINLSELNEFARELMGNRLHNKDIPKIVRQNQYKIRHEQHRNELMGDCVRMGSNSMIATGSAQMACA